MEKRDSNVTFLRDITNDWFSSGFDPKLCSKDATLECLNDLPNTPTTIYTCNHKSNFEINSVSGMAS